MKFYFIRDSLFLRIMRYSSITLAISIVAVQLVFSADGIAQGVLDRKASISVVNSSLAAVFGQLNQQTKVNFVYSSQADVDQSVSLSVHNSTLARILNRILPDANLEYEVVGERVVIKNTGLQQRISGKVTSAGGEALAGVNVRVKDGNAGTSTDGNGNFSLSAPANAVLVFRYLGYKSKEVSIGSQSTLAVVLEEDVNELEAVEVVSTGYQTLDRKLFTGAATTLKAENIQRNGIPDVSRMLEGQVAGVSIQNVSGTFGAAPKIRIRGATSLSGDNKPLWVVDGIILEDVVNISNEALSTGDANTLIGSSVAGLNPDDIESFTILKDAAATAMYGARAMNGVIVVNTKKGRNTAGKPAINYSGTFTTYLKPTYDNFDIMNSAEQMSVMIELENKGFLSHAGVSRTRDGGVFYKMYNEMYDYDPITDQFALRNDMASRMDFLTRYAEANTDWFDILFKNSLLQEHSLSINTGTAASQTYFSTSLTSDNGQTLGDNVKRYTANLRNNLKLNDKLSAELLVNGSIRDQRSPGTLTRQSDPVYGTYSRDFDINPYSYSLNTSRMMTAYDENGDLEYFQRNYAPFNILNELDNNYLELNMLDLKVQAGLKYKIIPSLTYSVDGAYRYASSERQHFARDNSNMAGAFRAAGDATVIANNPFLYKDPEDPNATPVVILPEGGFFNSTNNHIKNYYFRQNLEFDNTFNVDHRLNVFGSMEIRYTDRQNSNYDGVGYQYENGGLVNPNYRYFKKLIEGGDPYFGMGYDYERFAAFSSRAAYSYKDKYSVNATLRYDGSNLMGKSNVARWLPTWNVSGAWNLDQEPFFNANNGILNSARIRATYGLTASLGNATNSSAVFYNQVSYRPYENEKESEIYISSLENSELTWEKLYELNIGTDLGLFNNRMNLTVDWYKRNIFDLIGDIRTSGIGGQFTKTANYGKMKAHGLELTLGGNVIKNSQEIGGLNWRTQFNFGINKNEITELEVDPNIWTTVRAEGAAVVGHAQRGLFSLQFDGLEHDSGNPTFIGTDGQKTSYIYLQSDDIDYLKYHGPIDPTFTGGFYNQVAFRGFSLSALFTFSTGNYVRLQPAYSSSYTDMYAMSEDMVNRWIMPGDEQHTNIPSMLDILYADIRVLDENGSDIDPRYPYNIYNYSTERVAKGDFVRLKNVTLTYLLPKSFYSKLRMSNAQISLVANNVALLYSDDKLNGADPEFFNNGGVAMPVPKQYTLSLKFGF